MRAYIEYRLLKPLYHPNQSNDFHNGGQAKWMIDLNSVLNFLRKLPSNEIRDLKRLIIDGEDNSSWYIFDVRELGFIRALHGYNDGDLNLGTAKDIRIGPPWKYLNINDLNNGGENYHKKVYESDSNEEHFKDGNYDSDQHSDYIDGGLITESGWMIDEQTALQGVAFHTGIQIVFNKFHVTMARETKNFAEFFLPRGEHGDQEPRLRNNQSVRLRVRPPGTPTPWDGGGDESVVIDRWAYERMGGGHISMFYGGGIFIE